MLARRGNLTIVVSALALAGAAAIQDNQARVFLARGGQGEKMGPVATDDDTTGADAVRPNRLVGRGDRQRLAQLHDIVFPGA